MSGTVFDKIPNICLLCAGPASGKTSFVQYVIVDLFSKGKMSYGICMCPTNFNNSYSFLPKKYVYSHIDEDVIVKLMNLQIKQIKEHGKAKPAFIIFDDCVALIDFKGPVFNRLITTYRHYNILLIFTT